MQIKKIILLGIIINFSLANEINYNIYINFKLKNEKNITKEYNKIITDTVEIIKKSGNKKNKCEFKIKEKNIEIKCKDVKKEVIPLMNKYINNNIYNKQEILEYKIIRKDQEITEMIKKKSENIINKIKKIFEERR